MDEAQREAYKRVSDDDMRVLSDFVVGQGSATIAGRVLLAGYDIATGGEPCLCPECLLSVTMAISIGADFIARSGEASILAALDGTRERWDASLPPNGVEKAEDYRTIARNLRLLYPLE
jgi:uncharacterized Zn-binding protein involved in type VI secretion